MPNRHIRTLWPPHAAARSTAFVIPKDFEADAVAGRTPVIDYYSNMTYYVPGTFLFKGFKTTSVTSAAGMMRASLTASGMEDDRAMNIVQPMTIETHAPGNPWTNYSMYLTRRS